jgi:hypothetical protein
VAPARGGRARPVVPRPAVRSWARRPATIGVALLTLLAYGPLLLTAPGDVGADTKQFLYLEPGRLLSRAPYLWDPNVGAGTVTHQNIGYLWPMGPWFWVFDRLGVPDWLAQRLFLGTVLLAAALGVRYLGRRVGLGRDGGEAPVVVAALFYMLSPYTLAYLGRTTAILLPWAGLPWLVGLTIEAARRGGWRYPAVFALVATTVGGTNASSFLYAGLAAALWLPFAVGGREITARRAVGTALRIGALSLFTATWWMAGLRNQARYGLPVLDLTETVETVVETSSPAEIVRQLGYWYFYGKDGVGAWTVAVADYTQRVWLVLVSFALPALAFLAAAVVRWRSRAYFVALVALGFVLGIGPFPYDDPSPLGGVFKSAAEASTAALAFRNSPRAVPLLSLGCAMLLGAGVAALAGRIRPAGLAAAALCGILGLVNLPPLWQGELVQPQLRRPEDLPSWWTDGAAFLDGRGDDTRVLELPGSDFGAYRWGHTQDLVTPGLMDRPWVGRELIPFGSPESADLLRALDRRLQEGQLDPDAVAPLARLMAVGDVLVHTDLEYERYRTPRPRPLWALFAPDPPDGLAAPTTFGPDPYVNVAQESQPLRDEQELGTPTTDPFGPPVAVFPVEDPRPIVRTESADRPLLVAGDGEGLVELAAAGLLDGAGSVLYSASLADDPDTLAAALDAGADLVVTDTNRRRAQRWGTLRENNGYTEQAGEEALENDPKDARLDVFPDAGDGAASVVVPGGGAAGGRGAAHGAGGGAGGVSVTAVRASDYGNPVSYTPEDRPAHALDGDPRTAWKVGAFDEVRGEYLRVELSGPLSLDGLHLTQPSTARWITQATIELSDGSSVETALLAPFEAPEGQAVAFAPRTVTWFEIHVDDVSLPRQSDYAGVPPVGLAEIGLRGPGIATDEPLRFDEVVRLPEDLLSAEPLAQDGSPDGSLDHTLTLVLARLRANAAEPFRADPETHLARSFALPSARSFGLEGEVRIADGAPDHLIDVLLGRPGADHGGLTARASDHLAGSLPARASSAFDGDPTTAWSPGFSDQTGRWVEVTVAEPVTVDRLDLQVLADGRHSVPTQVAITADGGAPVLVDVPAIDDGPEPGHVETAPVALPGPVTGRTIRLTVTGVREQTTLDFYQGVPIAMPVGIVEAGVPGVQAAPLPALVPEVCRDDLLTVDGRPVAVAVTGATAAAVAREALAVRLCDDPALDLAAGPHVLRTVNGRDSGLDIDRLVLSSARGGAARRAADGWAAERRDPPPATVERTGHNEFTVRVAPSDEPSWLVLGESRNDAWHATVDGDDLGPPTAIDGYANGWLLPASATEVVVLVEWTAQGVVWIGIAVAVVGVLVCAALILFAGRCRPAPSAPHPAHHAGEPDEAAPRFEALWRAGGRRPGRAVAALAVAAGALGVLLSGPVLGLVAAALAAVASLDRRGRTLVAALPVVALGGVGVYVALKQHRNGFAAGVEWPSNFDPAQWWVILAVVALVIAAAVNDREREPEPPDAPSARRAATGDGRATPTP